MRTTTLQSTNGKYYTGLVLPGYQGAIIAWGLTVPSSEPGFAVNGLFFDGDGTGNARVFINQGTAASCSFVALGTPAAAAAAPTAALTTITSTAPGTPDYAVQDLTQTTPFGFVTKDEGNSVLAVVANLQTRVNEAIAALQAAGLMS